MTGAEETLLLDVARDSIRTSLRTGSPWLPDPLLFPEWLREVRASFVTLRREGELRGCIGALDARDPLVVDVARHAFAAAFRDPRFPALEEPELAGLDIHVSILTVPETLHVSSEEDLLCRLRPGIDGLILEVDGKRGTFLPAVWKSVPDPRDFLLELKRKTGLAADFWSGAVRVQRYTAVSVPAEELSK